MAMLGVYPSWHKESLLSDHSIHHLNITAEEIAIWKPEVTQKNSAMLFINIFYHVYRRLYLYSFMCRQ